VHGDYLLPNMAKPTPQQRWNDFVQGCSALDFRIATRGDLEDIVSTTLQLEHRLTGDDIPPNPTEIERRADRFGEARKYFENHTAQLASQKNSVIGVLGEIMRLDQIYSIGKDYCTTVAAYFFEAIPYLLGEREFGGADQGIEQVPIYSLDLILRAAQTEISDFETELASGNTVRRLNVAAELVQSFGLKRYTGPDQNIPFGLKALEVTGLSGHFYRPTLFEAKLGERQSGFEKRKLNRQITIFLAANLIAFTAGEIYLSANDYSGEDLGDVVADAVYGSLPESDITKGEAAKADAPKKGKRLGYVAPAVEGETLIPEDGCGCPRNLQREYFGRLVMVENGASEEKIQTIIDDFRAGITFDYVIKDGRSVVELMLGPRESYEGSVYQQSYDDVSKTVRDLIDSGKIHLYTPTRKQDPGTLILQPTAKASSRGGK